LDFGNVPIITYKTIFENGFYPARGIPEAGKPVRHMKNLIPIFRISFRHPFFEVLIRKNFSGTMQPFSF